MSLTLRTVAPSGDPSLALVLERAFGRAEREALLVARLASGIPTFDAGLALVAAREGRDVGGAVFLPRALRLRGVPVALAVVAPLGVPPPERGAGVGTFLLRAGFAAARDRRLRGIVALGAPEFFARHGFAPAFNLYTTTVAVGELPAGGEQDRWRGITQADIPRLRALYEENYSGVDGTECRTEAALDWESSAPHSHTLVYEERGAPEAYLRFRVRGGVEIREGAVASELGVAAVLRFLRRLAREHGRPAVEVHLPPPHPVARALFHRGATAASSHFGGAAELAVADWAGLLDDTAPAWAAALRAAGVGVVSLDAGGQRVALALTSDGLRVEPGREERCHVHLPAALAPGLVTGQRSYRDLLDHAEARERSRLDEAGRRLLPFLFPPGTPMWTYSPLFELADD